MNDDLYAYLTIKVNIGFLNEAKFRKMELIITTEKLYCSTLIIFCIGLTFEK